GTQAVEGRQRAAEVVGGGGVHDPVEVGGGTRFGGGEVADHEVGDVRLVAQVPADGRGVLVRSPDDLVGVEIPPEVLGVGQGPVVLGEQFGQGLEAVVHIGSLLGQAVVRSAHGWTAVRIASAARRRTRAA